MTDERLKRFIWQCQSRYQVKGEIGCENGHVDELALKDVFVEAFNKVIESKEKVENHLLVQIEMDNPLEKYRTIQLLKTIEDGNFINEFDVDTIYKYVECPMINEERHIIFRFLTGIKFEPVC